MAARFMLKEAFYRRDSNIVLVGTLLEGRVSRGDSIAIPLETGGEYVHRILDMEFEHRKADEMDAAKAGCQALLVRWRQISISDFQIGGTAVITEKQS